MWDLSPGGPTMPMSEKMGEGSPVCKYDITTGTCQDSDITYATAYLANSSILYEWLTEELVASPVAPV